MTTTHTYTQTANAARPFIKQIGGKTQLLPELLARLPVGFDAYHEVFVGGGALFFALVARQQEENVLFRRAFLNDACPDLVNAFQQIQSNREALEARLTTMQSYYMEPGHAEAYFYEVRACDPTNLSALACAARFIFLKKTAFNGLWRVNKKGLHNAPWGHYEKPNICDSENLRAVEQALDGARLTCESFDVVAGRAQPNELIYFDPPYAPASETANFTTYTSDGFNAADHEVLRDCARRLAYRGVHVMLSNSDTPFTRGLYDNQPWCKVERVQARRAVNCKGAGRGKVSELIIRAGPGVMP